MEQDAVGVCEMTSETVTGLPALSHEPSNVYANDNKRVVDELLLSKEY